MLGGKDRRAGPNGANVIQCDINEPHFAFHAKLAPLTCVSFRCSSCSATELESPLHDTLLPCCPRIHTVAPMQVRPARFYKFVGSFRSRSIVITPFSVSCSAFCIETLHRQGAEERVWQRRTVCASIQPDYTPPRLFSCYHWGRSPHLFSFPFIVSLTGQDSRA